MSTKGRAGQGRAEQGRAGRITGTTYEAKRDGAANGFTILHIMTAHGRHVQEFETRLLPLPQIRQLAISELYIAIALGQVAILLICSLNIASASHQSPNMFSRLTTFLLICTAVAHGTQGLCGPMLLPPDLRVYLTSVL